MLTMPKTLPDDPILLKQLLLAASALPAGSDGSDGSGGANREWHAEHTALVDAVLAGEVDAARRASERQCDRTADLLRAAS